MKLMKMVIIKVRMFLMKERIVNIIKQLIKKKLIVKKSKMNFIQKFMKSILFFVTNLKIQNLKRQIGG